MQRPLILSIAGHDPSAGAGISADIKTAEMHGVYCMSCVTSLTVQTEDTFKSVNFVKNKILSKQVKELLKRYKFSAIKIGLIKSLKCLEKVVKLVRKYDNAVPIIWDPIMKASAGFEFHSALNRDIIDKILNNITLVTPNIPESEIIYANRDYLNYSCAVLFKGGHTENTVCSDLLYYQDAEYKFSSNKLPFTKHGTGCILSSAIASNVALGHSIDEACKLAKDYINKALSSNTGLLAYHG